MFVCSVKSSGSKIIAVVLVLLLLLLGFIIFSQLDFGGKPDADGTTAEESLLVKTDQPLSYAAADASERQAFIKQFGWTVREDPAEIAEVLIPAEFDEVYRKYNDLQKSQGLDLESFQGQRVKRWSYVVTDYPEYENTEEIRINLLIQKGVVIGGDVCSLAENGFMHGFSRENIGTGSQNAS